MTERPPPPPYAVASLTTSLAVQGALIEIGWEAPDLVVRAWQLAGFEGQAGRDITGKGGPMAPRGRGRCRSKK